MMVDSLVEISSREGADTGPCLDTAQVKKTRPRARAAEVPQDALDRAAVMRKAGHNWTEVSKEVGFSREVLRYRIDKAWRKRRAELRIERHEYGRRRHEALPKLAGYRGLLIERPTYIPPRVLEDRDKLLALEPRDLTAAFCGDPLPGRSALDRKCFA